MSEHTEAVITRGVRNNNPGNIRIGVPWDGRKLPNTDGAFDQFISPQYGIRALMKLLLAYQDRHGLDTIDKIISRWAPPSDGNDTAAYKRAVSIHMNRGIWDILDLHDGETLMALSCAIIAEECAGYKYSDATMRDALAMVHPQVA